MAAKKKKKAKKASSPSRARKRPRKKQKQAMSLEEVLLAHKSYLASRRKAAAVRKAKTTRKKGGSRARKRKPSKGTMTPYQIFLANSTRGDHDMAMRNPKWRFHPDTGAKLLPKGETWEEMMTTECKRGGWCGPDNKYSR